MRICIGVTEICGIIPILADAFRQLGHEVITVIHHPHKYVPAKYDFDFSKSGLTVETAVLSGYLMEHCDLFIFLWARTSFLPELADIPFLKSIGKKIAMLCVGSDVREYTAYKMWNSGDKEYLDSIPLVIEPVATSLRYLRSAEKYSDAVFSQPNQSVLGVRPYHHFFPPLNLADYPFNVPGRDVPVVLHVPSKRNVKGGDFYMPILDRLQAQGYKFELRLLENISIHDVQKQLFDADIILDELGFTLHGKQMIEAMASGCAGASGDNEELDPYPPKRPIWRLRPHNVEERLKILLSDKALRIDLAMSGRRFVEQYHSHVAVAARLLMDLERAANNDYDYYPSFYTTQYQLPAGAVIPKELLDQTSEIISKYGCAADVDLRQLISRGLVSADRLPADLKVPIWPYKPKTGINGKRSPQEVSGFVGVKQR